MTGLEKYAKYTLGHFFILFLYFIISIKNLNSSHDSSCMEICVSSLYLKYIHSIETIDVI